MDMVSDYADIIARRHCLLTLLELPLDNEDVYDVVSNILIVIPRKKLLSSKDINLKNFGRIALESIQILQREFGFSGEFLSESIYQCSRRKGVVLGVTEQVAKDFIIVSGDDNGDVGLICPSGINYRYFSGIEPLGDEEYDYLVQLQERADS